jgi:23S rRNA (adenine2503-C2)-methyltransferase
LFTDSYSKGLLETLSIGDYGKSKNIKADFLGFYNEINGVPNGECLPLSEKWVITISTQYDCVMNCTFCDCPKIKFRGNATVEDMKQQIKTAIDLNTTLDPDLCYTDRLNIHFARCGEPMFNTNNVFFLAEDLQCNKLAYQKSWGLRVETIHPVFTTCLPKVINSLNTLSKLQEWCNIKNELYKGQAGLQLSINSTNNKQRDEMFNGGVHQLEDIADICNKLPEPIGRKYCLNFALADDYEIDANLLSKLFNSEHFMCKITPIHNNNACRQNGIQTNAGYNTYTPYREVEEKLKEVGFDVLVFIPSSDEEDSLVTCGNLILSQQEN